MSECGLFWVYGALFGGGGGWVSGGGSGIVLGEWGWVVKCFWWVGVSGMSRGEWRWMEVSGGGYNV